MTFNYLGYIDFYLLLWYNKYRGDSMKLCLENINKDVDYDDLCFFESHLSHELKRLGKEGFVEKYRNGVDAIGSYPRKALLCSILSYLNSSLNYELRVSSFILDGYDFLDFLDGDLSEDSLRSIYNNTPKAFRNYGVLYRKFGGFADGTFY